MGHFDKQVDVSAAPHEKSEGQSQAPTPIDGVDLKRLPIGPTEAFVMSRVDGRAQIPQIALETGLDRAAVEQAIRRLAELGAVRVTGIEPPPASTSPAPEVSSVEAAAKPPPPRDPQPPEDRGRTRGPTFPVGSEPTIRTATEPPELYDPAELDAPGDLPRERKRRVLDLYYQLEKATHYEVLGIGLSAQKSDVKSAYYELVSVLHPDKYFGKDLGGFRTKLEKCFQRITLAHDTLAKKKARAEYDAYLSSINATAAFDEDRHGHSERVVRIQQEVEEEARRAAGQRSSRPASADGPAASSSPHASPSERRDSGERAVSRPPPTAEERRRHAARRFGGSMPPGHRSSRPPSGAREISAADAAAQDLKRRYEVKVKGALKTRIERYVAQAENAEKNGDPLAAANLLRLAVSLAPDDAALAERFRRVESVATGKVAGKYLEQGAYEERNGQFAAAATSFERALKGRPDDASLLARTANCYMKAGKDLKRAAELARTAVDRAPDTLGYRMTLARIYAAADMAKSALAELERAKTLSPDDASLKALIKQIRRGES